jgi:hypothetical protein
MKVPSCVLWGLTKKFNAQLVKFQGNEFSHDPLNLTGLHNASSAGTCNDSGLGITLQRVKSKTGKKFKREYTVLQKHKSHNKQTKAKKDSQSGNLYSTVKVNHGPLRVNKMLKGISGISSLVRKQALHKLRRLHKASPTTIRKQVTFNKKANRKTK